MTGPTFYRPSDLSTDPSGIRVGGGDWKYLVDVLDGTHTTDRIQAPVIEGLIQNYDVIVYKTGGSIIARRDSGSIVSSGVADTDDTTVLQTVFNLFSSSNPGTIVIKPGTYHAKTPRPTVNSNTTIIGYGGGGGDRPTFLSTVKNGSPLQTAQGAQNVRLIGLTFDQANIGAAVVARGSNASGAVKNLLIQDCAFKNPPNTTIADVNNNWLLTIPHSNRDAPTEYNENIRILNCDFDGTGGNDTYEILIMSTVKNGKVDGCTFRNTSQGKNAALSFFVNNLDCIASNNTFSGSFSSAIHDINVSQSTNTLVVGNHVETSIRIADARYCNIVGNFGGCVRIQDADAETHDLLPSLYRGSQHINIVGNQFNTFPESPDTGFSHDAAIFFNLANAEANPPKHISIIGNQARVWKTFIRMHNTGADSNGQTNPVEDVVIARNHITERTIGTTTGGGLIRIEGNAAVPNDGFKDIYIIGNIFPLASASIPDVDLTTTGMTNIHIRDNFFKNTGVTNPNTYTGAANNFGTSASNRFQNSGTVSFNAQTQTVTHGLSFTPTLADIQITPTSDLGSAARFWISSPTSTQFTINLNAAPGATVSFSWWARRI